MLDLFKILVEAWTQVPAGLLTAILCFFGGFVVQWIADRNLRTIPSRMLLGLKDPATIRLVLGVPWGIIPNTSRLSVLEGMPIFGYGPLHAYSHLAKIMATAYPKLKNIPFTISRAFPMKELDHDLILIGFPLGNEITKMVMNDLNLPLIFKNHQLVETATGDVKYEATVINKAVVEDYGCLIRTPNPYAPDRTILILAGCETYGVKAAAEFLIPHNFHYLRATRRFNGILLALFSNLIHKTIGSEYYLVIVSTKVRGLFTSKPSLVKHYKLPGRKDIMSKPLPPPTPTNLQPCESFE